MAFVDYADASINNLLPSTGCYLSPFERCWLRPLVVAFCPAITVGSSSYISVAFLFLCRPLSRWWLPGRRRRYPALFGSVFAHLDLVRSGCHSVVDSSLSLLVSVRLRPWLCLRLRSRLCMAIVRRCFFLAASFHCPFVVSCRLASCVLSVIRPTVWPRLSGSPALSALFGPSAVGRLFWPRSVAWTLFSRHPVVCR